MKGSMKVLLLANPGVLGKDGSGDKSQILNTAEELEKLGLDFEVSDDKNIDMMPFDIVHIFQMDWSPGSYFYSQRAKKLGKKIVLSPIHHILSEVKKFDDEYVFGYRRFTKYMFREQHARDTYKMVYRAIFNPSRIPWLVATVFKGLKNMHRIALQNADAVMVQTDVEAEDLERIYGVKIKSVKVPNGVGHQFLEPKPTTAQSQFGEYVLCVGRIEARKNQLSLIKAMKKVRDQVPNLNLLLIGKWSKNHREYSNLIRNELVGSTWVKHLEFVPYSRIPTYFHNAKLTVSASWFESTGLTLLESLFCGTNAVASGKPAREILGNMVEYCAPGDVDSIKEAILKSLSRPTPVLPDDFRTTYTWESVAKKTLEVYRGL